MADEQKPQDPTAEQSKELKKLLDSHLAVLTHKYKRAPTMEELTKFLTEERQPEATPSAEAQPDQQPGEAEPTEPGEPKVLSYKLYYGMKNANGKREPDPRKVLFYETGEGQCYDTSKNEWCPERPPIMDHLSSRPLEFDEGGHDIMSAIVHGVIDDEDFNALNHADMLNDHHREVFRLTKQAQSQLAELQKSQEQAGEQIEPSEGGESEAPQAEAAEESAEPQEGVEEQGEDGDLSGENVLEQIIAGAMAEALDGALGDLDGRIRAIVREELKRTRGGEQQQETDFADYTEQS